jgi:hypothetical protein
LALAAFGFGSFWVWWPLLFGFGFGSLWLWWPMVLGGIHVVGSVVVLTLFALASDICTVA